MPLPNKKLPQLSTLSMRGKRVLIRVDWNVSVANGRVVDDFRIRATIPTLKTIRAKGGKLMVIAHCKKGQSIKPIMERGMKLLGEKFEYLANLREDPREENNSVAFGKSLSKFGDVYVNEAFSASHRKHASIVQLPKLLPAAFGPLFLTEVKKLAEVVHPTHPFLFILGGAKFSTKIPLLDAIAHNADAVMVLGGNTNTFLVAQGSSVGKSLYEKQAINRVKSHYSGQKFLLPYDVRVQKNVVKSVADINKNDVIVDVGPATLSDLEPLVAASRMVLWNGPLGIIEKGYDKGTRDVIRMLADAPGKVIVGGGDTHLLIHQLKKEASFYHVSTGGGAMLDFLADGTLPGIEAFGTNKKR